MHHSDRPEMKVILGGNQMSLIRDTEEVVKFLEFAGRKSILSEHAVNCRLTACHNLFSVLNEEEDSLEYILQNLDILINRFRNKNPNVQASTLKVYKSRLKGSLEDFKAWSADPFAWERSLMDKAKAANIEQRKAKSKEKKKEKEQLATTPKPPRKVAAKSKTPVEESFTVSLGPVENERRRVSFPIRPDFSLDFDLPAGGITLKELRRIGLFLYPYCIDADLDSQESPILK